METAEIRRRWLAFFEQRGHTVVPSAPLVHADPNLLFVNAGMVPFKPYFLGQETPPYQRATSVQKCVRTLDIEEVGQTTRHGTFFQMQGNFSFGDYFKEGAIELAWELLTTSQRDGGLGFDEKDLYASVYQDDNEAISLWRKVAGLPESRIVRLGKKDNYWHMGVAGPGGPCSEILLDRGPEFGADGDWEAGDRYLEFWNLVFMQYELENVRSKEDFDIVGDLPKRNIDTGMGLERVAFLTQGVDNIYETDEVYPVIEAAEELSGRHYGADHGDDVRFRVVADHVRSSLMLIGDGVTPGNEGRGYVLRRLLRRAVRSMRLLGVDAPSLEHLLPVSMGRMKSSYPELERDFDRIGQVAYGEEDAFRRTLAAGTTILDVSVAKAKQSGSSRLGGAEAFALHDTYGFPIDLTLEMAAEQGLQVDEAGFRRLMDEQRGRAKADAKAKKAAHGDTLVYRGLADALGRDVEFTGYDQVATEATVRGLVRDGEVVDHAVVGDTVEVVLDRTPLYAESGGQQADHGRIRLQNGALLEVLDVQRPITGLVVHRATVLEGEVRTGETAEAEVDVTRRRSISRAHTATHMVHQALRDELGPTATQAGSENSPGRLRFDFKSLQAVPAAAMAEIEARINAVLLDDLPVTADIMSLDAARKTGAMALFGEKYGERVRVVSIGDWSRELCVGTHTPRVGQIGVVKLLGESSIGSGVRRVEALVGSDAYQHLAREAALVSQLTDTLAVRPEELPERIAGLVARLREAEKEIATVRQGQVLGAATALVATARDLGGVSFVSHDAGEGVTPDDLRALVLDVRNRLGNDRPSLVSMSAVANGRPVVVVATNERAREQGLKAGAFVKLAATALGGGGGGKDDLAQGGGSDATAVPAALGAVEDALRTRGA
ncbi:alanine--tRNA ligase [Terracoccus luteus]|uniref:Alanine--tRNA ligase n=1 Tax=Terracoccus luteus TaxID=53356 RepID=A0A839PXN7_9MICO|nr:alanine--tRNA ligase [Terracoccus luteus]MBB2987853.1 alanyl-tRNA synthetase [Terracoccus luteus]MCP2173504.1 alanyl-tRNA synthetase [Terracoccus luteus]